MTLQGILLLSCIIRMQVQHLEKVTITARYTSKKQWETMLNHTDASNL